LVANSFDFLVITQVFHTNGYFISC